MRSIQIAIDMKICQLIAKSAYIILVWQQQLSKSPVLIESAREREREEIERDSERGIQYLQLLFKFWMPIFR